MGKGVELRSSWECLGDLERVVRRGTGGVGGKGSRLIPHAQTIKSHLYNEWGGRVSDLNCQAGSGEHSRARGSEWHSPPPRDPPIWSPHLRQQLQQRPVRISATELAQASEEGSRVRGH